MKQGRIGRTVFVVSVDGELIFSTTSVKAAVAGAEWYSCELQAGVATVEKVFTSGDSLLR